MPYINKSRIWRKSCWGAAQYQKKEISLKYFWLRCHMFNIMCPHASYEKWIYYMASSVSGQDSESNPALWLATRTGKMELSCPLWTRKKNVPQEKCPRKPYNKSFIDQACSRWLDIGLVLFFASLWTSTPSRSVLTRKRRTWPISSHLDLTLAQ